MSGKYISFESLSPLKYNAREAMMNIREERGEDVAGIHSVNQRAFGTQAEANLVDKLRLKGRLSISLVAEEDKQLIGHIAFSPVTIDPGPANLRGAGLAPMAVLPVHQRKGIGSQLVSAGLAACRRAGFDYVVVLGHPTFYPRFGFSPAARSGVLCAWPVPEEVFMVTEFRPGALDGVNGTARYDEAFNEV